MKALWHKYLGGKSKPWCQMEFRDGAMQVVDFNDAYVTALREKLGEVANKKTDTEVVAIVNSREATEVEEPRLDVLHSSIDEEGRVKLKLDWNSAFITMLRKHGIGTVEQTEEEIVQLYLAYIQSEAGGVPAYEVKDFANDELSNDFAAIDAEAEREIAAANKALRKAERNQLKAEREARKARKSKGVK